MVVDYIELGKRIKKIRKSKGITQEQLAENIGLSTQYISNLETAKSKGSLETIVKIANIFEVSVDELLCDSVKKSRDFQLNDITMEMRDCTNKEMKMILKGGMREQTDSRMC